MARQLKLPSAELATVDASKVTEYLLSPTHPDGSSKAAFFMRFGFRIQSWEILAAALRAHGMAYAVVQQTQSRFGARYAVDGRITSPDGRNPRIRTVWLIEAGHTAPRLITAYPI